MSAFVDALNESAVTYIPDVERYGWAHIPGSGAPIDGWEAISPAGEIRCFDTRKEAQAWRITEVRAYVAWKEGRA